MGANEKFDLFDQLCAITNSQNVARRLGANILGQRVHAWAIKNMRHIPNESLKELMSLITEDA